MATDRQRRERLTELWDAIAQGRPHPETSGEADSLATIAWFQAKGELPVPDAVRERARERMRQAIRYAVDHQQLEDTMTALATTTPAIPWNGNGRHPAAHARPAPRRERRLALNVGTALLVLLVAMTGFLFYRSEDHAALPPLQSTASPVPATPDAMPADAFRITGAGDPAYTRNLTGVGPQANPVELWQYPAPGQGAGMMIGPFAVAADGVMYAGNNAIPGGLVAIDLKTGAELWRTAEAGGRPALDGDGLIARSNTPDASGGYDLVRVNLSDGSIVWRAEQGKIGENMGSNIADGVGYTGSGSELIAFDPATGARIWSAPLQAPVSRGVSVGEGLVTTADEKGTYYAFGLDGAPRWTFATDATTAGGPTIAGGRVFLTPRGETSPHLYALDARSGDLLWQFEAPVHGYVYGPAVAGDTLYASDSVSVLRAFDVATGAVKWTHDIGERDSNTLSLYGDTLYLGGVAGFMYAFDAATGEERWRFDVGSEVDFVPIVQDGVVYVRTTSGILHALGEGQPGAPAPAVASPTVAPATPPAPAGTAAATVIAGAEPVAVQWVAYGDADHSLHAPGLAAIDPEGHIWVTSMPGEFFIFDLDGNLLETWGSPGSGPGQFRFTDNNGNDVGNVLFASEGSFWVADTFNFRIQRFDKDRQLLGVWGSQGRGDGQFLAPTGLALDADGNLLVADLLRNDVQRFTPDGQFLDKFGGSGARHGQLDHPAGLAVAPDGSLWVPDIANHRVEIFAPDGTYLATLGRNGAAGGYFDGPDQVAFDAQGHAYVSDQFNNRVQVFDLQGRFLYAFGSLGTEAGQFNTAASVVVYRDATVIVVDWKNDRIQKFRVVGPFPAPDPSAIPLAPATPVG